MILDLPDAQLLATLSELPLDGPVRAIRSGQLGGGGTRIVLDLRQAVRPRSFALEPQAGKGHRLVLDLYPQALAAPPEPMLALARPLPSTGRDILVVVDAGHGGKDPGAVGSKGEREKDVALAIARLLARRIDREKGFKRAWCATAMCSSRCASGRKWPGATTPTCSFRCTPTRRRD